MMTAMKNGATMTATAATMTHKHRYDGRDRHDRQESSKARQFRCRLLENVITSIK
jgi:hypothetical protein